ncbi:MAG: thioredoxin domain-containing protein [Candidatus Pacearchaeota archaeon]|jgi:hypothetical protein
MEESNQEQKVEPKRRNDWKILSAILGVVVVILLIVMVYPRITGNVISGDDAGSKIVDFLNGQTGGGVTYVSSTEKGDLYEVMVSYQGQEIPVYVTKDGQYFVQSPVPIDESTQSTDNPSTNTPKDVPKTDKPVVDAYIFSYCPYGLQFEKGLQPVYDLLKNKADINIVAIGAMHGEFERVESLRQICIQKIYGKDKLWNYLKTFNTDTAIGACNGDATCVDPLIDKIYLTYGFDKTKIESCMKTDAPAIYDAQGKQAQGLGISGSPTFVINGVQVQVDRTPEAIKTAVCNAFTTAPSECSKTLSTSALTAGFGASAGASTGASC